MKVRLNQIPAEGLHAEDVESADILEIQDPFIKPVSFVDYSLDIGISEDGLFATGTMGVELEMQCVRCLQFFQRRLEIDAFAMQMELGGSEMIDLTPFMREDILLALPAHPHCDWDGAVECPGLAPVRSSESLPEHEKTISAPKAWDALDQLKIS